MTLDDLLRLVRSAIQDKEAVIRTVYEWQVQRNMTAFQLLAAASFTAFVGVGIGLVTRENLVTLGRAGWAAVGGVLALGVLSAVGAAVFSWRIWTTHREYLRVIMLYGDYSARTGRR